MAGPEKRWQLLLVADDGRIIPFKRVKGIAVILVVLLVLMGVVCAGLWWQLTAEKVRHGHAKKQLEEVNTQIAQYKSEHELMTAQLVLAQARMEKAGVLPPKRQERISQQKPLLLASTPPDSDSAIESKEIKTSQSPETQKDIDPTADSQPLLQLKTTQKTETDPKIKPDENETAASAKKVESAVALGDLEMRHDQRKKRLRARFRVKNTGSRTSPVAGRCVVVLKSDGMDPTDWWTLPPVTMVNGKPDGSKGKAFKISNYKNLTIETLVPADPSSFKTATIHVFDRSGPQVLEKDYPIDIPVPVPVPKTMIEPAAKNKPAVATEASRTDSETLLKISPATAENGPETSPMKTEKSVKDESISDSTLTSTPVDDPSLTNDAIKSKKEDSRARF